MSLFTPASIFMMKTVKSLRIKDCAIEVYML